MLKIQIPPVQIVDQNNDPIDWSSIKSKYLSKGHDAWLYHTSL